MIRYVFEEKTTHVVYVGDPWLRSLSRRKRVWLDALVLSIYQAGKQPDKRFVKDLELEYEIRIREKRGLFVRELFIAKRLLKFGVQIPEQLLK